MFCPQNRRGRPQFLVLPREGALFYNVKEPAQEESHKHKYSPKTAPTQTFEIHRVGVEKDHLHVKQHKENGNQEILDSHWLAGFPMGFDPGSEGSQLVGGLPLWTQQMGDDHQRTDHAYGKKELQAYGQVAFCAVRGRYGSAYVRL